LLQTLNLPHSHNNTNNNQCICPRQSQREMQQILVAIGDDQGLLTQSHK